MKHVTKCHSPYLGLTFNFLALFALFCVSNMVSADSLGGVAENVRGSMQDVGQLITAASYVAGIGFALLGLLKLKAHKDNPTQVPLSQPLVLLTIAGGLVFLPSIISTAEDTIWGDGGGTAGGFDGSGVDDL